MIAANTKTATFYRDRVQKNSVALPASMPAAFTNGAIRVGFGDANTGPDMENFAGDLGELLVVTSPSLTWQCQIRRYLSPRWGTP